MEFRQRTRQLGASRPREWGAYRLLARLGRDERGTVFLASGPAGNNGPAERQVAIKIFDRGRDPVRFERLKAEISTALWMDPFCTARVLDAGWDDDAPYVVSEFITGPTLREFVDETGPLTGSVLERVALGMITALAAIHSARIVHRDFKPENVVLSPNGPRVVDYGIARRLDTARTARDIMGIAPERLSGAEVGTSTDVFGWAVAVVFAATGRSPYGDESLRQVVHRIFNEPPDLRGLTGRLRDVVAACLPVDPAARPTATELLFELVETPALSTLPALLALPVSRRQLSADPADLAEGASVAGSVGFDALVPADTAISTPQELPPEPTPELAPELPSETAPEPARGSPRRRWWKW